MIHDLMKILNAQKTCTKYFTTFLEQRDYLGLWLKFHAMQNF